MDAAAEHAIMSARPLQLAARHFAICLSANNAKMGNKSSTEAGSAAGEGPEIYLSEDLQGKLSCAWWFETN